LRELLDILRDEKREGIHDTPYPVLYVKQAHNNHIHSHEMDLNHLLRSSSTRFRTFMKHFEHFSARRIIISSSAPFNDACKCHKRLEYILPLSIRPFSTDKNKNKHFIRDLEHLPNLCAEDLSLLGIAVKEGEGKNMSSNMETNFSVDSIPGTSKGGSRKLAILFTCKVCDTRSAKKFTERAYNHGVVLVRCPKCDNLHLIADNLGYFTDDKDGWNIEKLKHMSERENVLVSGNDEVLELAFDDKIDSSTTDDNVDNNKAK